MNILKVDNFQKCCSTFGNVDNEHDKLFTYAKDHANGLLVYMEKQ